MMKRTALFLLLTALALNSTAEASVPETQKELLHQIRQTWQKRQARCQSGVIRWKKDEFYAEGAYGSNDRIDSNVIEYELAFKENGKCSSLLDGLRWNTDEKRFDHESYQNAILDGDVKMLFAGKRHGQFPAGFLCQRQSLEWGQGDCNLEIPILTFRPLASSISWFSLSDWDIVGDSEVVNNRRCILLTKATPLEQRLWLDIERGYLPVQHDRFFEGQLWSRLTADYSPHEITGWIPQTWRYVRTAYVDSSEQWHQKVTEGFTSTVIGFEANIPLPDSKFDITFPPGTRIQNERTGEVSLVREDGTIRPVDLEELRSNEITWEMMMHTDPPSLIKRRQRILFWGLAAGGFACTIALVFYWRRRTRTV